MSAYGLGLGLGMTSIAAAVARGSAVDVVPAGGDPASMAAPALAYATHGGRIATGADARRRAIGSPDRLVSRVLHDVASSSSVIAGDSADAALATRSRADDPVRALRAMVQGVITAVAAGQGGDPARLTVTHPTPWSDDQVAALADAVRPVVPGGGVLQLIPSAVAVAVDYTVDHPLADGAAVGVVDVGATGFEAAVVGRRGTELVLLSPRVAHGPIGGDQFDDAVLQLVDRAADGAVTALNEATTLQAQIARDRLRRDCRLAKEALSTDKAADHHRLPAHRHGHGRSHPHRVRRRHPRPGRGPGRDDQPRPGRRPGRRGAAGHRAHRRLHPDPAAAATARPRRERSARGRPLRRRARRSDPGRTGSLGRPSQNGAMSSTTEQAPATDSRRGEPPDQFARGAGQAVTVIRTASNAGTWSGQAPIGMR